MMVNYYAVLNLDNATVATVESSEWAAQATMFALAHSAQPHLIPPVRNLLIVPVDSALFVAYSEGKGLELDFDNSSDQVVPIVRIAQRRQEDKSVRELMTDCIG